MDPIFQAPLPDRFALALRLEKQLENGDFRPGSPEHNKQFRRTLALLSTCLLMTEQLNILDASQSLDEITTKSLKYLSTDYYIAKILDSSYINPSEGSLVARLRVAKAALRKMYDFMLVLSDHDLLDEYLEAQATPHATLPEGRYGRSQIPALMDLVVYNNEKMSARFKTARSGSRAPTAEVVFSANAGNDHNDELHEDDHHLEATKLRRLGRLAVDQMRSSWREIELLIFAVPERLRQQLCHEPEEAYMPHILMVAQNIGRGRPPSSDVLANPDIDDPNLLAAAGAGSGGFTFTDAREAMKQSGEDFSTRVDATVAANDPNALLGPQGQVLRPFVLTDGRDQIARKVMGTGQVLPTMSIEEAAAYEMKHRAKSASESVQPSVDEDSNHYVDMETMKARQWDEFTEANPRGSGNTMNRG